MTKPTRISWVTSIFLVSTALGAFLWGPVHVYRHGVTPFEIGLLLVFAVATGFSITGGYHRLFSHGAYDCARPVKVFYLLFGAAAFQQSVLTWASEHRKHHAGIDTEKDPYNIQRGFFWAHVGWMLVREEDVRNDDFSNVKDLAADPWIRAQHQFYGPIAAGMCFGLPLAIGWAVGNPWGALLWGGLIRLVYVHHSTFCVNSLAHMIGRQPYTLAVSARDSLVTALMTLGEGYHNFHHRFATDYRNGIRWYHFDPTKWAVRSMEQLGLAWALTRTPREKIVAAELECETEGLVGRWRGRSERAAAAVHDRLAELSVAVHGAAARLGELEREFAAWRAERSLEPHPRLDWLKAEMDVARKELRQARLRWREMLEELGRAPFPELA